MPTPLPRKGQTHTSLLFGSPVPPWPSKQRDGRPRPTSLSFNDARAARPRARTRPPRARLKRKREKEIAAPAAPALGQVCDWISPIVPSRFSQDSHLDPRTFGGHSLQLGRVFDSGGRALDRAIVFCAKRGAVCWERADALCRSCSEIPGGRTSQLHKLRSGLFPNKRCPGWTVEHVRRPTLDEVTTLVTNLAGLVRAEPLFGRPHPKSNALPRRQWCWSTGNALPGRPQQRTWHCSPGTRVGWACWRRMGPTISRRQSLPLRLRVLVLAR